MDFPLRIDVEGTHWTVDIPGQLLARQQNSTLGPVYSDYWVYIRKRNESIMLLIVKKYFL